MDNAQADSAIWRDDDYGIKVTDPRLVGRHNSVVAYVQILHKNGTGIEVVLPGEVLITNSSRVEEFLVDVPNGLELKADLLRIAGDERNRLIEKKASKKKDEPSRREQDVRGPGEEWMDALHYDARGRSVSEDVHNITLALEYHQKWQGRFSFDSFLNQILIDGEQSLSDAGLANIIRWFGATDPFQFSGNYEKRYQRGIYSTAIQNTFDSLYDWITSLEWDGTPRLLTWMPRMCGSPDTPLSAWIGKMTIMEMTARALTPGCMARQVPVWEGPENKGKTRTIKALGDPWAITFDMSMDTKEAHMAVQGVWVGELAELDTLRKTSESRLKSFISQTDDTFIPKYSNNRAAYPRRAVFIGTTNDDDYLPPKGTSTRWYPIRTEWFNHQMVRQERNQLFAEAVAIFKANPDIDWWEEPASLKKEIAASRKARRAFNPYEAKLKEWLEGEETTTWPKIADGLLQLDMKDWKDKSLQAQITDALKALGWRKNHTETVNEWLAPIDEA